MMPKSRKLATHAKSFIGILVLLVTSFSPVLLVSNRADASITNTRGDTAGTVEVAGSGWLAASGVDIYSNGNSASNTWGNSCVPITGAAATSQCTAGNVWAGSKWQCVEMINRLYLTKGWTTAIWPGNGNTLVSSLPSGLTSQSNGSISSLSSGDVITLDDGGDGHAGIINSAGTAIQIANQNTTAVYSTASITAGSLSAGTATLGMSGWAGYSVQGVIHHPASSTPPPAGPIASPVIVPNNSSGLTIGGFTGFAIGAGGDLETAWQTSPGSSWTGWSSLSGSLDTSYTPVIVPNNSSGLTIGGFTAFAIGTGGDLKTAWQSSPGSSWTAWNSLGGNLKGGVVVVPNNSSGLTSGGWTAFALGSGGDLKTAWQTSPGSSWSAWNSLGGSLAGSPVIVPNNSAGLTIGGFTAFVIGSGGDLKTAWQSSPGSAWSAWNSLGGSLNTSQTPVVVTNNSSGLTIGGFTAFAVGSGNDLKTVWQTSPGSSWSAWNSLGGALAGSPTVVANNSSGLTIGGFTSFVPGTSGDLKTAWQTSPGSGWSAWNSLGGSLNTNQGPVVVANNSSGLTIGGFTSFAIGSGNDLKTAWQSSPGSSWSAWNSLGGNLK